jgi:tetratricopeptide (TPR) repeat protein
MRNKVLALAAVVLISAVGFFGWRFWRQHSVDQSLIAARRAMQEGDLSLARVHANRVLQVVENDGEALLIKAESIAKDPSYDDESAYQKTRELLRSVPETSPFASQARLREAAILFFERLRACEAESTLRELMKTDPENTECLDLLIRILCATGRAQDIEPLIWKRYELEPESTRASILATWFETQFFISSFNRSTDVSVGLIAPNDQPTKQTTLARLVNFRTSEPDCFPVAGGVGNWFNQTADAAMTLDMMDLIIPNAPEALKDSCFVRNLVSAYFVEGQFEKAVEALSKWPEHAKGEFEYFVWVGIMAQENDRDYPKAIEAFNKAVEIWPGQADSTTFFRLANCLEQVGEAEKSKAIAQHSEKIKQLLLPETLEDLQKRTTRLQDVSSYEAMSQFYKELRRPKESGYWQQAKKFAAEYGNK